MAGVQVLAALGEAPVAVIAVAAILLGVLLAARGPREKRAGGGADATIEGLPAAERSAEEAPPATGKEPSWRVAARAANPAVRFRAIKTGGRRKNR